MQDELIQEFLDHYGDKLPDPDHFPNVFRFLFRLFMYAKTAQ